MGGPGANLVRLNERGSRGAAMRLARNRPKLSGMESGKRNTNYKNYSRILLVICGVGADPRLVQSISQIWSCSTTKHHRAFVLSHGLQLTIRHVVGTGVKIESRWFHMELSPNTTYVPEFWFRISSYNLHARIMISNNDFIFRSTYRF
jgi:hypothetical protein